MSKIILILMSSFTLLASTAPAPGFKLESIKNKLSPILMKKMQEDFLALQIPAIVVMKKQADLSSAEAISRKEDKTAFVVKTLWDLAKSDQTDISTMLENENGLKFRQFYIFNGLVLYNASRELIAKVAARDDVERVYYNPTIKKKDQPEVNNFSGTPESSVTQGLQNIEALKLWKLGHKGKDVVVGIQDTGVDLKHPALEKKYRGKTKLGYDHRYSWHDSIHFDINNSSNKCDYDIKAPCDDSQHGSHVTGTVLGSTSEKSIGVAPEAKWVGCRNMDSGDGTPATYIECYEYFLAPYPQAVNPLDSYKNLKPSKSVDVIANSWGCPKSEGCDTEEILLAVKAIRAAGIVNVLSAGNEGRAGCGTIATQAATFSDYTFSVGAIDARNDVIANFSSRGPSSFDGKVGPDISAPGVGVYSSVPGGGYQKMSGTSMAGPHIAGLVALLISARPEVRGQVERIEQAIIKGALGKEASKECGGLPKGSIPNNSYGHGIAKGLKAFHQL